MALDNRWGPGPWGQECWGGNCFTDKVEFTEVDPPCETVNNPSGSEIEFVITSSNPLDQIILNSVVIYIGIDSLGLRSEAETKWAIVERIDRDAFTKRQMNRAVREYQIGYQRHDRYAGAEGIYPYGPADSLPAEEQYWDAVKQGFGEQKAAEEQAAEGEGWTFPTLVYLNSSFNPPWTGTVFPEGIGFRFHIKPPSTWPRGYRVRVTVYAESLLGLQGDLICDWRVEEVPYLTLEIISLTKLLVRFSEKLSYNSGADNINNWEILPVDSGFVNDSNNIVHVIKTIPDGSSRNPLFVVMDTTEMVPNQRYKLICRNLKNIYGRVVNASILFLMRRTKVDNHLAGLPSVFEVGRTSNFFWVMSAIGKSDEKISATFRDVDI